MEPKEERIGYIGLECVITFSALLLMSVASLYI